MIDYLATTALDAIVAARPEMRSWIDDKSIQLEDRDRLSVLRWIVTGLDESNQEIVASALGVSVADLEAVGRVLKRI